MKPALSPCALSDAPKALGAAVLPTPLRCYRGFRGPLPPPHHSPGLINWLPTFFSEFYHVEIGDLSGFTMTPYLIQVRLLLVFTTKATSERVRVFHWLSFNKVVGRDAAPKGCSCC